jgi:bifunctional UDP-N-acetylglucosamine pyrophosphorylase/glucosamine-1-phosphate N-acetyltransferase
MTSLHAIVLAAGQGKRMKSALNKVLHTVAGRPLVFYPVRAALEAGAERAVVVVNPDNKAAVEEYLKREFGADRIRTAVQDPPRGTGDAARVGLAQVESERVLILYGDTPLLRADELRALVAQIDGDKSAELSLMSCSLENAAGYGRVLREANGAVREVREDKDLRSDAERATTEVNAGVYAVRTSMLRDALATLTPSNAQGEYYLTDVVAVAAKSRGAHALPGHPDALLGVNDRSQLAEAEEILFRRIGMRHAAQGVTIHGDPKIDDSVTIEPDAVIEAGVRLRGATAVGAGAIIDVGCVVQDSRIGPRALLKPYSVVTNSIVEDEAQIGPFAHLRPESHIERAAHIGNFVETKKTRVRQGAKANHLSYIGDADIGESVNIGAGTIFCNYDGFQKHITVIKPGAFIGSDSQLVAPVTIGKDAFVATGTTVTADVPDEALAIGRTRQENKLGYAPKLRAKLSEAAAKAKQQRK